MDYNITNVFFFLLISGGQQQKEKVGAVIQLLLVHLWYHIDPLVGLSSVTKNLIYSGIWHA